MDNACMPSGSMLSRPSRVGGGVGGCTEGEGDAEVARVRVDCRVGGGDDCGTLRFCADDGRGGGECVSTRAPGKGLC